MNLHHHARAWRDEVRYAKTSYGQNKHAHRSFVLIVYSLEHILCKRNVFVLFFVLCDLNRNMYVRVCLDGHHVRECNLLQKHKLHHFQHVRKKKFALLH